MTTEVIKSTAVSNADATPRVPNESFEDAGIVRASTGFVTVTSGKTTGSIYPIVRVPTNCRVISVRITNAAGSASSAFDVGVYAPNGGAAVSAALFGSAIACTNANVDLDITGESTTYTNAQRLKRLWDAAGASSDPGGSYDICLTSTATNAASFAVGLEVLWTL